MAKFRLEPLLRLRRFAEDEAKRRVAERLRQIAATQERIDLLRDQLEAALEDMRKLVLGGPIVPIEAGRQRGYIGSLRYQLLRAEAELRSQMAQLAAERAALAEASKRKKILEKLKERQHQRLLQQQRRIEQAETDELGCSRYILQMIGADS